MSKVTFMGNVFDSELDRNRYVYENIYNVKNSDEISKYVHNSIFNYEEGIIGLFFILLIVFWIAFSSFIISLIIVLGLPLSILYYLKSVKISEINNYGLDYEKYIKSIEQKIRRDILEPFKKRYNSGVEMKNNIPDLTNLINHELNKNLNYMDVSNILIFNLNESEISQLNENISKIKNKNNESIVESFINFYEYINWDDKSEVSSKLQLLYKCLILCNYAKVKSPIDSIDTGIGVEYLGIEYGNIYPEMIEKELEIQLKKNKALKFKEKLAKNEVKKYDKQYIDSLNGFEFEEFIGKLYEKSGYKILVTKKSGDHGVDLVVEKNNISTAIQTKNYSGSVGNTSIQEVVAGKKYYDCDEAIVITNSYFTKGAYTLAEVNKVKLIDGKELEKLIDNTF